MKKVVDGQDGIFFTTFSTKKIFLIPINLWLLGYI
jgi:hypothetical protein